MPRDADLPPGWTADLRCPGDGADDCVPGVPGEEAVVSLVQGDDPATATGFVVLQLHHPPDAEARRALVEQTTSALPVGAYETAPTTLPDGGQVPGERGEGRTEPLETGGWSGTGAGREFVLVGADGQELPGGPRRGGAAVLGRDDLVLLVQVGDTGGATDGSADASAAAAQRWAQLVVDRLAGAGA